MDNYNSPLISIQSQIDGIRSDIYGLNSGLSNIGELILRDSSLDRLRLREEEQEEKTLLQQQVKVGKETAIEQRVTDSIAAPIENVEGKLQNTFSGVENALKTLFVGTLSTLGVNGLKFASNAIGTAIDSTKALIANSFKLIGGAFSSIKNGFGFVSNSIGGLIKSIGGIATKLISSPFKAISDAFKSITGIFRGGGGGVAGAADDLGGASLSTFGKLFGKLLAPAAAAGIDVAFGESPDRAIAGAAGGTAAGAAGAAAGSIFGPVGSFMGGLTGFTFGSMGTKQLYDQFKPGESSFQMPQIGLNFDAEKTFGQLTKGATELMSGLSGNMSTNIPRQTQTTQIDGIENNNIPGSQPAPTPIKVEPYKPPQQQKADLKLPEQKPDVILTSTLSQQQEQQVPTLTSPEDIPFIPSSNTDNFYILYSQLNYNVVM